MYEEIPLFVVRFFSSFREALCSLALPLAALVLRAGLTVNRLSPFISVVHFPDCIFKHQSSHEVILSINPV